MSSNTCFDINAYLQVIGVSPSQLIHGADPDSLKLIYSNHVRTLPFSSLPIVCGHPVDPDLDVAGIADRMASGKCFSNRNFGDPVNFCSYLLVYTTISDLHNDCRASSHLFYFPKLFTARSPCLPGRLA
ncbi:hypothetical protein Vafri_13195 [Volvox africanus]|uniref:Uncharacterized protein n=1 Tax=Volvox africanus TaxID=51714 RepID=A0A8J4BC76_9CHLO|nr:hypothetical protein Vafri_13195 [Volvox africanus]